MNVTRLNGQYDLVLYGLGVMGENFIRNFARKGYRVIGVNRTVAVTERFAAQAAGEDIAPRVGTAETLVEACKHLKSPGGAVLAMINANDPVVEPWGPIDDLFFKGSKAKYSDTDQRDVPPLVDLVPPGTVVIDAANSHPRDTRRRCAEFARRNMPFIGTGVSGGAEGALKGPCIMPGGSRAAYAPVAAMLEAVAAQVDGPCCAYMGDNEAGHFVKNVHNGIEYGIMQAISEVYHALAVLLDCPPGQLQPAFAEMTAGRHGGYLMEITTEILGMTDRETGRPMVDVILDRAGQKGTGKWTSQIAFDLGVPIPTIAAALQARIMSAFKPQREAASRRLKLRRLGRLGRKERTQLVEAASDALYGTMVAAYSQGFWLLSEASAADPAQNGGDYSFTLVLDEIARIWKGGCIIRSKLLDPIRQAFRDKPDLHNVMLAPEFRETLSEKRFQTNWRRWVVDMARFGLPMDAVAASLVYFDTYRTGRLPANMIQAQRDRFGEHGFERTDKPGKGYHLDPAG
jgi:6-phosphogluconate dehydrogenase